MSGAVVVLVDEIPTRAVVIAAPGPSLPNIGWVDVEVLYVDRTTVALEDVR